MKKSLSRLSLLCFLILTLLCGSFVSCRVLFPDLPGNSTTGTTAAPTEDEIAELRALALSELRAFYVEKAEKPPETGQEETTPAHTVTEEEMIAFTGLVDFEAALLAEGMYREYYVGEFRPVAKSLRALYERAEAAYYVERVQDSEAATAIFINAYIDVSGDRFGSYYPPSSSEDYVGKLEGEYSGIGVSVTLNDENYIDILTVFPDSPAEKAGILPGDLLVAINGEDVAEIGYQEAVSRVRGEIGTSVRVTVLRDGVRLEKKVTRAKVTEVTVTGKLLSGGVGYMQITSFDDKTYDQFAEVYEWLVKNGATSLIFDLRNNPGGTLTSVLATLEYILPDTSENGIVHMRYKDATVTLKGIRDYSPAYMVNRTYYPNHAINLPMAVLANGRTASAGELFTSALQDYGVALVIGETTYGKGVGQSSMPLYVGTGEKYGILALTTFYYDPPTSKNYNGVGIVPNRMVELPESAKNKPVFRMTPEEDTQLAAAYEEMKSAGSAALPAA